MKRLIVLCALSLVGCSIVEQGPRIPVQEDPCPDYQTVRSGTPACLKENMLAAFPEAPHCNVDPETRRRTACPEENASETWARRRDLEVIPARNRALDQLARWQEPSPEPPEMSRSKAEFIRHEQERKNRIKEAMCSNWTNLSQRAQLFEYEWERINGCETKGKICSEYGLKAKAEAAAYRAEADRYRSTYCY